MNQYEDREEGVAPSKTTHWKEHENQNKAQSVRQRVAYFSEASCVSVKSDHSMDRPVAFKDKHHSADEDYEAPDSPVTSCVSMKSDHSMDRPVAFKDRNYSADKESGSAMNQYEDREKWASPSKTTHWKEHENQNKAQSVRQRVAYFSEASCVSVKSDHSMDRPVAFKDKHHSADEEIYCSTLDFPSVKDDYRIYPPVFYQNVHQSHYDP